MSVASVKRRWSAISLPRSQVSDRYSSWGSFCACLIRALTTVSVSFLATFASIHVARLTLHQRRDLAVLAAKQRVTFPVARKRTIFDRRGTLADRYRVSDLSVD